MVTLVSYNPNQPSPHSLNNKVLRVIWNVVWLIFFRPSPKPLHGWRRFLLRIFGAKIGKDVHPYPSAKIWAPWNLEMDEGSCLADHTDCYCVSKIKIGKRSTVSQYSYLCGATHDYEHPLLPLVSAPIIIGDQVWITADVFVAPGVTIGDGAVVGARSSVFSDVEPWSVVAGNPAKFIKRREIKQI